MGFSVQCYLPITFIVCYYIGQYFKFTVSGEENTVKCSEDF